MITIKSKKEIEILRAGGKILAETLKKTATKAKPGVTTQELNDYATEQILLAGAMPAFLGYDGFPAALCTSVNEQVVHGVPSDYKLKDGDVLGLDLGVIYPPENCAGCPSAGACASEPGFFTDAALTVIVGRDVHKAKDLVEAAEGALKAAIACVKAGARVGDIGEATQKYVEARGFSVIRELVGHGVGYAVHEEPQIPNFGEKGEGEVLKEGMVLALEPMLAAGHWKVVKGPDGMAYQMKDGSLASHFEHTIVVTKKGCEILTIAD